jgi:hypothetical protein
MLNDHCWAWRRINGRKYVFLARCLTRSGIIIGSTLLPNFKESSKDYESTRPDDPWTVVTSRSITIGDSDGDFCCRWLRPVAHSYFKSCL